MDVSRTISRLAAACLLAACTSLVQAQVLLASAPTGPVAPSPAPAPPPAPAPAPAIPPGTPSKSKLVSNVWVDMDIRQVVQDIAAQTDTVILCDQTVQGAVSMSVKDMALTDCLERICAPGGYSFTQVKDYFIIGRAEPGSPLFQRLSDPLRIKLTYITPDQVKTLLHPSLLTYVTFDKATGTVIITAPQPLREKILDSITQIDQVNPQVAIEAVVFELTEDGSKQLALDWQFKSGHFSVSSDNLMQTATYGAGTDFGTYVQATLRAIVESRRGQVLANPRVLVMNNTDAEIFVGQEKYFTLLSGQASNPYYTLQSIKAGVTLKVSPTIGKDGQITLALEPEVSDVVADASNGGMGSLQGGSSASFPVVTRRRAKTVVGVKDGETIMIGGLLREQHRQVIDKVPGVGDVPALGAAFRTVNESTERQEVVLLITVHLVDSKAAGTRQLTSRLMQRYVTPLDGIGLSRLESNPSLMPVPNAAPAKGAEKMKYLLNLLLLLLLLSATGCQQPSVPVKGFSLDRGAQLLAAGSPKSAIPFLTQTVAGVPDGPEPMALLSLAYALDLQGDRAILQAEKIHRPAGESPGWEAIAVGIARMTQNRPDEAVASFRRIPNSNLAAVAARQWMVLAMLQGAHETDAVEYLDALSTTEALKISASLWLVIVHEHHSRKELATAALQRCAQVAATASGMEALKTDLADADAQTLYDAGLAALAGGNLTRARELLTRVHEHTYDACDSALWLALIAGIRENWQACRNQLAEACDAGTAESRGLASQLFSVVCALENRPQAVVQYTLLGQRMMGRTGEPGYIHEQPKPETVWMSDQMN